MVAKDNTGERELLSVEGEEERQWLRQDKMHQEKILYTRINLSVVVLSILTVAFARTQHHLVRIVTGLFGIGLAVIWFLLIHRQRQIVDDLRDMLEASDGTYQKMRRIRSYRDEHMRWHVSGQSLIYRYLPLILIVYWLFLLAYSLVTALIA